MVQEGNQRSATRDMYYSVKHQLPCKAGSDVCLFSSYNFHSSVDEYVFYYLNELKQSGFRIAFITTSTLNEQDLEKLKMFSFFIVERENICPDFGSWKLALSLLDWGKDFNSILLANDSVFGPFRSIKKDIVELNKQYDIWGYSSNLEINYHLQSYFLHVNSKVVRSEFWISFWKQVEYISVKKEVVENYEVGFTQKAIAAKFRIGAFADAGRLANQLKLPSEYLNYTISAWKELIVSYNYPFLKRELLIKELAHSTNGGWASAIKTVFGSAYLKNIDTFLTRYREEFMQGKDIQFRIASKDVIVLSHYSKKLSVSQLMALNFASQIANTSDQPFLVYQLSSKKHEIGFQNIDHPKMRYLGALASDLLEQYIYHWNKSNVRAIIIDSESFNLFRSFFESFYSGNVIVVDTNETSILLKYLVRTSSIRSLTVPLEGHNLNKLQHSILLKSARSFLENSDFIRLKNAIEDQGLVVHWKEWSNQVSDSLDSNLNMAAVTGKRNESFDPELTIEFDEYTLSLIARNEVIYFTDDAEDFILQLQQQLSIISLSELEIKTVLEKRLFNVKHVEPIMDFCFSHPEVNVITSPSTSSFTHIFYEDTLYDLLPYLYNLSYLREHHYFFSISEETFNKHTISARLKKFFPGCFIQYVKNVGKDISGKLILWRLYDTLKLKSDYVLLLHDKKSLHSWTIEGHEWRLELFKIAEPQFLRETLDKFQNSKQLGIVGNKKWLNNTDFDYSRNRFAFHDSFFRKKLREYKIDIDSYEFIGGTMFWMRATLLDRFFEKYSLLTVLDKLETGNILDSTEGTETHFLERFFGWFASSENYTLEGI